MATHAGSIPGSAIAVVAMADAANVATATVKCRLIGDCNVNLAANAGVGSALSATATKTATTTLTGLEKYKIFGFTKVTGTGVKQCYWNGLGVGVVGG